MQIKRQKVYNYVVDVYFQYIIIFFDLVTEERNKYAVEICQRIREKLNGSDPDPLTQSSISEQV